MTVTALAAVLTAGTATGAAGAAETGTHDRDKGRSGAGKPRAEAPAGPEAPGTTITLITGDRVVVGGDGRVRSVRGAAGREDMTFRVTAFDGRTHVVPRDAERLIADDTVDRRLFDITELGSPEARAVYGNGVRALVVYGGPSTAKARTEVRGSGGTAELRGLPGADAVTATHRTGSALWEALTRTGPEGRLSATAGVEKVWLDAAVRPSLDTTTAQIGAPAAWSRTYDGTGVKIAVLDTGIDAAHPDLAGRVVAERNFSESADAKDRVGHGTHVASTAAGRGVKDARFKGVAPGATLLNGKVLDDFGGGSWSGVMAGVHWAVAQGADVVNLSLGGNDGPEIDPLEALINTYSAEKGVLFAVAAGNEGPRPGTVDSPGSAEAALTVGAVDDHDAVARFSARGPAADQGQKPELTAPGVGVTAAAAAGTADAEQPPGYTAMSGTSMATPHVAGAAAILKQKNPTWTGDRIKAVLTGSATPGAGTAYDQGAGRVTVGRALDQSVSSAPVSLAFGKQLWPHHDNAPATKAVTYRNTGTADVVLELAVDARNPAGGPAPAGFLTTDRQRLTVPAGGTASVGLTADTRVEGGGDGRYSATVIATGGGQSVRTPVTVEREVESYDVTVRAIDRDGSPDPNGMVRLAGYEGLGAATYHEPDLVNGTATVRVPKGLFFLDYVSSDPPPGQGTDIVNQPEVVVDRDLTVTVDTRLTEPLDITVPDPAAASVAADFGFALEGPMSYSSGHYTGGFANFRTAGIGTAKYPLIEARLGVWSVDDKQYAIHSGGRVDRFSTGLTKHYTKTEMAPVTIRPGGSVPGKLSAVRPIGTLPGLHPMGSINPGPLPSNRAQKVWVSTESGVKWNFAVTEYPTPTSSYDSAHVLPSARRFEPGGDYELALNVGAQGPALPAGYGGVRDGTQLWASVPLITDDRGNPGVPFAGRFETTLHRDGVLVGRHDNPLSGSGRGRFTVPDGDASYTLAATVERPTTVARVATRIEAGWTFRSAKTAEPTPLPLSVVRFGAKAGPDSTAPAGRVQLVPVTVQGAAAGTTPATLTTEISYDEGRTWQPLPVVRGLAPVVNPAAGKGVSFRGSVVDRDGNRGTVTVVNAYLGR
ncbi:S8 family serine peptidase [Streptomyces sp. NPDC006798]|uniref:S8 family peptidase n=1 Tax=Streptomyces sp. NPDC006798 TaxID=3155462 RepID=UPI0033D280DC